MIKSIKMTVCALATASAAPSYAADWVRISTASNGAVYFADGSTIVTEGTKKKVWIKIDFSRVKTEKARSALERWEFLCTGKQMRVASGVSYAPDGSTFNSFQNSYATWEDVIPDSMGEAVMEMICDRS